MNVQEVLEHFHTSLNGLSEDEAKKRLEIYGLNTFEKHRNPLIEVLLRSIFSPVNLMIFLAGLISYLIGKVHESFIIFFLLILNILIVFIQEYKSEKELENLKKKLKIKVKVIREGKVREIDSEYIVPGDIILLESEDIVPADIRIIEGEVIVDESAITGESMPREKTVGDELYASSLIRLGKVKGVVTATGMHTKYGKIIGIIQKEKSKNNLEIMILKIGYYLILTAFLLILVTFFYGYFVMKKSLYDLIIFSLAILISFIPTAMPAVISTILIYSASRLAKENILVRRLSSTFDLAQMNILCTDKTGTLTENKITLKKVIPVNSSEEEVLKYAYLASGEEKDPIDRAIIEKVKEKGLKIKEKVKEFFPYDSKRKYSYSIVVEDGKEIIVKKGSPMVLAEGYDISKYLEEGYRVLAITKDDKLIGFLLFYDPPRKDAKEFISNLKNLGIDIKMVTGDVLETALKIAEEVGIEKKGIRREKLYRILTDQHFKFLVNKYSVFAEVFPEDKYKIVKILRENNVVGVTGDGINDIPAFKVSNVGIAVYNATNAAKSFADLILTKPGLKQLVEAIKVSREALKRIENYIIYRVAENIRFPILITILMIIYRKLFLSPVHMLLLTVLNDVPIFAIALDKVGYYKKPKTMHLKRMILMSIVLGIVGVINSFLFVFIIMSKYNLPFLAIQTLLFLKLVITGHFLLFIIHSRERPWFEDLPSPPLLIAAITTELIGTLIAIEIFIISNFPIQAFYLVLFTWIYGFIWLNLTDLIKILLFKKVFK